MSPSDIRHFLVVKRFGKLERVDVFDDQDEAHRAYVQAERECGWVTAVPGEVPAAAECVLLGADSLSTCIATHGNWFDEPLDPLFEAVMTTPEDREKDTYPGGSGPYGV